MNGKLHLGHAFTICKAEFAARFSAFSASACCFRSGFTARECPSRHAEKLQAEVKQFGNPQFADEPPKAKRPRQRGAKRREKEKGKGC